MKPYHNDQEWNAIISILVIASLFLVVLSGVYLGNATHAGKAGYIYELELEYSQNPVTWSAVYGFAVPVDGFNNPWNFDFDGGSPLGQNNERNLIFECFQPNIVHELYASAVPLSSIDVGSLTAATAADVDAFMSLTSSSHMSATKTFTDTYSYSIGANTVVVPSTYTFKENEEPPVTFNLGILKDSGGNIVMVTEILDNFTSGFNSRIYNYQMLLPIPNGTTQTYYFWTDPFDQCPSGEGELPNTGKVEGIVTDENGVPLEDVIVEVAGYANVSDAIGNYSITAPAGNYNIYAVKTGYKVYKNNLTIFINQTTIHNIVLALDEEPTIFVGPGTSDGVDDEGTQTNDDVGPGQVDPIPIVIQRPQQIEGQDYIISISSLNRKLRIDNFLQEQIRIISFKTVPATVTFEIEGDNITKLISIDKESVTIEPNSQASIVITIFGQPPVGVYNGSLKIGGDLNETIPIELEILPKEQLPIEVMFMDLKILSTTVNPGGVLYFTNSLRNLLVDRQYPVNLLYTIQNSKGETYWSLNQSLYLQTTTAHNKKADLPKDLPLGDYVLRVTANYLGYTSGVSTQFLVKATWLEYRLFNRVPMKWIYVALLVIAAGIGLFLYIKKKLNATKRYHLKVYYDELPKPGPRTVFVGKIAETENKAYFNLENFKTHTIVAGSTGGGKSFAAQGIIEGMLDKDVAVIVFDPTAQWSGMLRKLTNKSILELYAGFGMKKTEAKAYPGNIRQITDPLEIIDIKKYMKPGEIQVFAVHKLDPKDLDVFVANTIREVFHLGFDESQNLRLVMCYDEVHRLLPKFGGSGEGFLQIERGCREFRKWGIGIALISQVLADFVGQIKANINTEVQMRTRDEGDLDRIKTKYGGEVLQSLVKASIGTGMVENPAYNHGQPYFITFRPIKHSVQRLTDEELTKYNEFNDQIDQLIFELDQLEEAKLDVFDLKLELKLALDKVKSGNFNMVGIYLEGLRPRIQKHWDKLGQTPKKFERKRASAADIQKAVEEAKADSAKAKEGEAAADAAKAEGAKTVEKKTESKMQKQVSFADSLTFSNGAQVTTMTEMLDVLDSMDPATFKASLAEKNVIEEWVREKVGFPAFADKLKELKTKDEFVAALKEEQTNPTKEGGTVAPTAEATTEKTPETAENKTGDEAKTDATAAETAEPEKKPEVEK